MIYIDLMLKKAIEREGKEYNLKEIINKNKISVILGSPGSGKTTLLKNIAYENKLNYEYTTVKNFLKLHEELKPNTQVLLLDGLDEYRITSSDKSFVTTELGNKVAKLMLQKNDLKLVISCREMDWYGEEDEGALKDQINTDKVELFKILPLNDMQQNEFLEQLEIKNKDNFFKKFSNKGFLENPQLLKMLRDIWSENQEDIFDKADIYMKFLLLAKENNKMQKKIKKYLDEETRLKLIGYLGFYYIFSGVDEFDEEIIESIILEKEGYTKENLEWILNTSIFMNKKFTHRTIAEFSLANFICKYKLENNIEKERIRNLFIKKGKIPTELRGTYAWICSISQDDSFILVDPYYQAIHGDNSLFSSNKKKSIILAVKEYSKINPYFYTWEHKIELENFYVADLDDLLIKEIEIALQNKTHYMYFLREVIIQGNNYTRKMIGFIKKILLDSKILSSYKYFYLGLLKEDIKFLSHVLEQIINDGLPDENEKLKNGILDILYPDYINSKEILKYLNLNKNKERTYIANEYSFLYKTPFDEKKELIYRILKKQKENNEKFYIPSKVKYFFKKYFLEVLLKYKESMDGKEIYEFIKDIRSYYPKYTSIDISGGSYMMNLNKEEISHKIEGLADELFKFFVEDELKKSLERIQRVVFSFKYFYDYTTPISYRRVLVSLMNNERSREANLYLFREAVFIKEENEGGKEELKKLSEKYGFESEYEAFINPPKDKYTLEMEKDKLIEEEETKKQKEENISYFETKSDEEILEHFGNLRWISEFFYFDKEDSRREDYVTPEMLMRFKKILKKAAIYKPNWNEQLTLESLSKNSPEALRYTDCIYQVALAFNNEENLLPYLNSRIELKKYFYILSLIGSDVCNIIKSNFHEKIEKNDFIFALATLKEFITLSLEYHLSKNIEVILKFINKEVNIERLKVLRNPIRSNETKISSSFITTFLKIYAFELNLIELKKITKISLNNESVDIVNTLVSFMERNKKEFSRNDAINLFVLVRGDFSEEYKNFKSLDSEKKACVLNYIMDQFDTEKSLESKDGIQTQKLECTSFLNREALNLLNLDELKRLLTYYNDEESIWRHKILYRISELSQKESDSQHTLYSVKKLKKFILENSIISKEDFFNEVVFSLEELAKEIEGNRNNDLDAFYNEEKGGREEYCRDMLSNRILDRYSSDWEVTREKYEANNRVDINIKYKKNYKYEVQIECKIDDNEGLYRGITEQLIGKYFSSKIRYGVYLIFYFGDLNPKGKKNKEEMIKKLKNEIPLKYENNIKIICIDLRKK